MEDKIRSILTHCKEVGDLAACFIDNDDLSSFIAGYITSVGDNTVVIQAIDESGEFDGNIVTRLDEIEKLQVGTYYLEYLKLLNESRGKIYQPEPTDLQQTPLSDIPAGLQYAKDHRILVTVQDYDKTAVIGFVTEVNEDWVEIETILQNGQSDGFTVLQIVDLARVTVGGKKEQAVGFVHQLRLGR